MDNMKTTEKLIEEIDDLLNRDTGGLGLTAIDHIESTVMLREARHKIAHLQEQMEYYREQAWRYTGNEIYIYPNYTINL